MLSLKRIFVSLICVATFCVAADTAFLSKNGVLYQDKNLKERMGDIFVASQVKVLSQSGDVSEVEFVGYAPEDSPVVYEKAGILMLGFEGTDFSTYKVVGKEVDEYDTEWFQVAIKGFIKTELLTKDKKSILSSGKQLFEARCGVCHDLHHKEEFIPNVWPSILKNMGAQAGLSNDEKMLIEKYLQEQ